MKVLKGVQWMIFSLKSLCAEDNKNRLFRFFYNIYSVEIFYLNDKDNCISYKLKILKTW